MNGHVCCILGICCPPQSDAQRDALASELEKEGLTRSDAEKASAAILKHFDLAPAGSLARFKADIARMARDRNAGV